jgi:tetratricopeptide (TPR) repeat protein
MEQRTKRNHPLHDLVSEYEAMVDRGDTAYLEEKNFFELIGYYEEDFQIDKAIKVTEHALSQYSYCVDFYLIAARLFLQNKNFEYGQQILHKAEMISPNDIEVKLLKARIMAKTGEPDKALNLLSTCKKLVTGMDKIEFYLAEASVHEAMKDFSRMFKSLSKALRLDPQNEVALEKMWMCVELTKKFKESVKIHEKVLDHDAYNYLAWFNLGHGLAGIGEYYKAINAMEYSFIINDEFELGYLDCAELCCQVQDYPKALRIYLEIAEQFESEEELLVQIADCYIHLGDYTKAKTYLIQALNQDQYNDEIYYFLGLCFMKEGKISNAITSFQKAIKIEDRREEYYCDLAQAYVANDEFGKAEFCFQRATEIGPEQEQYWVKHAQFLLQKQHPDKAMIVMEDADLHAVGPMLAYCRVACLYANNQRKEALKCLEEALIEDTKWHHILFETFPAIKEDKAICSMVQYYKGEAAYTI